MTTPESTSEKRTYVRYRDDLESPRPDEQKSIDKIIDVLHRNNERMWKKNKHAIRDAHAKSHGILRGELTVLADLPDHLRQGIFAKPTTYPVIARLSTTSGAIRSDQVRGVRGLGIKVIGVQGPRARPDDSITQDFVFVTSPVFPFADARAYASTGMVTAWVLARTPDAGLLTVGAVLRGASSVLQRLGRKLPGPLALFAGPNTNTLGETFYTAAPLRFGDYVAKLRVAPLSKSVTDLTGNAVSDGPDAHTNAVVDFFRTNSAQYLLSAQLCTDVTSMPIEDATKPWSESASPFLPVATITYPVQEAYSPARQAFGDDVLSFNSWRALAEHRPLGSINRLKKDVYDASSHFRHEKNSVGLFEPRDIADLPD